MTISWLQAALLGLFACLASMPGMGGSSVGNYTLGRPLVGGLVCGLILGDIALPTSAWAWKAPCPARRWSTTSSATSSPTTGR